VKGKKGVRNHITLLRAPTLAAFLPWGNSEGASCMTLTDCKNTVILEKSKRLGGFLWGGRTIGFFSLLTFLANDRRTIGFLQSVRAFGWLLAFKLLELR